jgi:exodeoxyribonuclease VII large subunit
VPDDRTLPLDFTLRPAAPPEVTRREGPPEVTRREGPPEVTQREGPPAPEQPPSPPAARISAPATGRAPASPAPPPSAAPAPAPAEEPRALTVAELNRAIRGALDGAFTLPVWVEGEVTGARPAPSGHLYFGLKDEKEEASIDVVVYRSNATPRMRALCVDGARLRVRGRPTFWAPRGRLQLVADRVQAAGRGALLEALERLKAKLAAEGLFAPERRRPIPAEPRAIGVVTSPSGAAIHDVCRVAFRRGGARLLLAPAQVQGAGAAESIVRALAMLQRVQDVDVIVVGRGGGSSDDLAAFNEEPVVRAVAACRVPVVSAVGHEVDVTLVDFAADARAATPSQAAELVVPDRAARAQLLRRTQLHMAKAMRARMMEDHVLLQRAARRLGDPRLAIAAHQQALDDRRARLAAALRASVARRRDLMTRVQHRLAALHPRTVLARERSDVARASDRLAACGRGLLEKRRAVLQRSGARLDALSPLKVLARGYAIATRDDGVAVRSARDVAPGDRLHLRVRAARIGALVTHVEPHEASVTEPADGAANGDAPGEV